MVGDYYCVGYVVDVDNVVVVGDCLVYVDVGDV